MLKQTLEAFIDATANGHQREDKLFGLLDKLNDKGLVGTLNYLSQITTEKTSRIIEINKIKDGSAVEEALEKYKKGAFNLTIEKAREHIVAELSRRQEKEMPGLIELLAKPKNELPAKPNKEELLKRLKTYDSEYLKNLFLA